MEATLDFEVALQSEMDAAIEQVTAALKTEGFGVLTRIDVRATLKEKIGAEFRPYVILGACHPPTAHKALSADARAGLMLPCNVTVEAAPGGGSTVRIVNPEVMLSGGGLERDPVLREAAADARGRLERVAGRLREGS